ncbi:MAG TPA: hypothetical protein VF867_02980 [Arthrobacter sp.]
MDTDEKTGTTVSRSSLLPGQLVHVLLGPTDLGAGTVDQRTTDGSIIWVRFGGATPRRMFLDEDPAVFTILPG